MKALIVGDMHVTVPELEDCQRLLDAIIDFSVGLDAVIFLGDQYNYHGLVHLEVMDFWRTNLEELTKKTVVIALEGNHDRPHGSELISSMRAHENIEDCIVVDHEPRRYDDVDFISYIKAPADFTVLAQRTYYKDANHRTPSDILICHQTFNGAMFENGFRPKDVVNPAELPYNHIVSGHIHLPQVLGKVWYPGSPRGRSLSDANTERFINIVEFHNGGYKLLQSISTSIFCKQIRYALDTPEQPLQVSFDKNTKWHIDIEGPPDWVRTRKELYAGKGAQIRTKIRRTVTRSVHESMGLQASLEAYTKGFQPTMGTPSGVLQERISRLWVN